MPVFNAQKIEHVVFMVQTCESHPNICYMKIYPSNMYKQWCTYEYYTLYYQNKYNTRYANNTEKKASILNINARIFYNDKLIY